MSYRDGATTSIPQSFPQLSLKYQRAVVLKSEGRTHVAIAETRRWSWGPCSPNTVNQWFCGWWRERAVADYNEQLAHASVRAAQPALQMAALPAVVTLVQLLKMMIQAFGYAQPWLYWIGTLSRTVSGEPGQVTQLPPELAESMDAVTGNWLVPKEEISSKLSQEGWRT